MIARTRRLLGITLAVLLVLVVGAVALAEHRGWPMLRAPLERSLTDAAGVPVRLGGNFHLDLVTGSRIAVQELYVGAADGVEVPHLVNARDVAIDWRWADLWHWWRGTAPLTPRMYVSALLQYNSSNNAFSTNARLRWEYQPGSELFVVFTEGRSTVGPGYPFMETRGFVVKINRLFRM